MADVIEKVTAPVTVPLGWAKARPVVFTLFLLIVFVVAIRFRETIAAGIARIPVVGKWITGIAHATAAVAVVAGALLALGGLQ